jgi:hypothetical protein
MGYRRHRSILVVAGNRVVDGARVRVLPRNGEWLGNFRNQFGIFSRREKE